MTDQSATSLKSLLSFLPGPLQSMIVAPLFVGLFIKEWGSLERIMAYLVADLGGKSRSIYLEEFLDQHAADQLKAFRTALENDPELAAVRSADLCAEIGALVAIRNDIVHGFWGAINEDNDFILYRKQRKIPGILARPFGIDELLEAVTRVQQSASAIITISLERRGLA